MVRQSALKITLMSDVLRLEVRVATVGLPSILLFMIT